LQNNKRLASKVRAECVGPGKKVKLCRSITLTARVPKEDAFFELVNSDAIWYNQDESGNIAGSLKVLEAMAVGVPILLPRYDAREVELGSEYPYFWDLKSGTSIREPKQKDFSKTLSSLIEITGSERQFVASELREKAFKHSYDPVSNFLKDEIEKYLEGRNK
jgi:glycosyltransferase involved in cell wall biosynthesis